MEGLMKKMFYIESFFFSIQKVNIKVGNSSNYSERKSKAKEESIKFQLNIYCTVKVLEC